ncbi:MAG: tetratricopeptide repeat protein [Candidatus Electrothrix aestuarii]|uniref:Tetratricopeptide repeat protein n=1 Tax=Candidatus Electrothrix aestuarii TaxID=3062594 RepID=A0AAU8LQ92_9BACT|nr:tetratricopeptide repeat protein [Candidatus Electrothrix aestuarii]
MSLDYLTETKIKEAEDKWEQMTKRLALLEKDQILETRSEERLRREGDISRMKEERQQVEQELKELHAQKEPQAPVASIRSNLPQQSLFFGRTKELSKIAEAISPEARTWGALIDGPGGIGKTALAIRAGHDAPAQDFERRIFLSAKVRELTPTGEQPLDDFSLRDFLSLLAELARELDAEAAAQAKPEERAKAVHRALNGQRILLVIDNVETFPEGERVRLYQFLSRLPGGCKAVVTSRRRADIDARVIRLDRLERQDALDLLAALAEDNRHLQQATVKEREMLYGVTNGNPLLLRWTVGQLGRPGSRCRTVADACAFLENAPKGNDPLEYVFGDLLDTFTPTETAVLAALAHFSHPAPVDQVAAVAGIAEQAARTALEDLNDRALLVGDEENEHFLLPKLAAGFIRRKRPEQVAESSCRLTERAYSLALEYGYNKYDRFPKLEDEWPLLAAALPCFVRGENDRLQRVCFALDTFLDFSGRWDDLLVLCQQAENKALAAQDSTNAGWRAYYAEMICYGRRQATEVLACADRCAEYWAEAGVREHSTALQLRGMGHELAKDYAAALAAYQESLALVRTIAPESTDMVNALNSIALVEEKLGDFAAAERNLKEALRIAEKIRYQEGVAYLTGNLADFAFKQEDWPQAEELARQSLEMAEQIGRQVLVGANYRRIAKALARQGRPKEGLDYAHRAVDIFTQLRQPDELAIAQTALQECVGGV